jgi:Ca2+-transporting ATPase
MSFERGVVFHKTEVFRNKYIWYAVAGCTIITMLSYWVIPLRKVLAVSIYGWADFSIVIFASFLSLFLIQLVKRMRWVI